MVPGTPGTMVGNARRGEVNPSLSEGMFLTPSPPPAAAAGFLLALFKLIKLPQYPFPPIYLPYYQPGLVSISTVGILPLRFLQLYL